MTVNNYLALKTTAFIILNYNNYEDTLNCIESVEYYNTAPIKLIVVDNGSTRHGTVESLKRYIEEKYAGRYLHLDDEELSVKVSSSLVTLPYATFIESSSNDGYARGNNKALRLIEKDAEVEYVMILNNDVLFVQDIISKLVEKYEQLEDVAILSPILYKHGMKELDLNCARLNTTLKMELTYNFGCYLFQLLHITNPYLKSRYLIRDEYNLLPLIEIELPSGSCMFIRKSLFRTMGFFDPNTFLYNEENILFKKVEWMRMKNYLVTDLKCIHLGAKSTSISPNLFSLNCSIDSSRYYMKNYANLSSWQYRLFILSQYFCKACFKLQKKVWSLFSKD